MDLRERSRTLVTGAAASLQQVAPALGDAVYPLVEAVVTAFRNGNKLLICGNGGSAADAQHVAAEFVNRFKIERPPLAAIALTTDSSILTSIGNDYSYDLIFSKQVEALGKPGDVFLGITTSGNSPNVLKALEVARAKGLVTAALLGRDGGRARALADIAIVVPLQDTARIQEAHFVVEHTLCELVDEVLFGSGVKA
jgi:D-sedoheptulose 7-phosphate isomerase